MTQGPGGARKPLDGVRVLDLSNFLAAPMSSMYLADFGADVIKVERPGQGDEVRHWGESKDGIAGSAQSTFVRICAALEAPEIVKDERFATNRARLKNAVALDEVLQKHIETFDRADLIERFMAKDATVAPVNNVKDILEDPHVLARENVVTVHDEELGGPVRIQNVVGKLSRTPGEVTRAGPILGEHNREILVERLGYWEAELAKHGIDIAPASVRQAAE